jgi:hypothetical protein
VADTSDVSTRPRQRLDEAILYRIAHARHKNRDWMVLRLLLRDANRCSSNTHNDVYSIGDELTNSLSQFLRRAGPKDKQEVAARLSGVLWPLFDVIQLPELISESKHVIRLCVLFGLVRTWSVIYLTAVPSRYVARPKRQYPDPERLVLGVAGIRTDEQQQRDHQPDNSSHQSPMQPAKR